MLLQAKTLLLHAHAQIAPQIERIHGGAEGGLVFLVFQIPGTVWEREKVDGQTCIIIQGYGLGFLSAICKEAGQLIRCQRQIQSVARALSIQPHLRAHFLGTDRCHACHGFHQGFGDGHGQRRETLLQSRGAHGVGRQLVRLRGQVIHPAGQHGAHTAHFAVYMPDSIDDDPLRADQRQVAVAAHDLQIQTLLYMVAHFVHAVEHQHQDAVTAHLLHIQNARALQVLAHQHAEHGRFGGVLVGLYRQLGTGLIGIGTEQQLVVAAAGADAQYQRVPFRLIHFIHTTAQQGFPQLALHK